MAMHRDMDLIRNILKDIENGENRFHPISVEIGCHLGIDESECMAEDDAQRLEYHLNLVQENALVTFTKAGTYWHVDSITWKGHDFLDSVRDDSVWAKTKATAKSAGAYTFDLLIELAKNIARQEISKHTGIKF